MYIHVSLNSVSVGCKQEILPQELEPVPLSRGLGGPTRMSGRSGQGTFHDCCLMVRVPDEPSSIPGAVRFSEK
jgi:hypothetical protein